jgi:hypothetical protein
VGVEANQKFEESTRGAFDGLTGTKQAVRESTKNDSEVDLSVLPVHATVRSVPAPDCPESAAPMNRRADAQQDPHVVSPAVMQPHAAVHRLGQRAVPVPIGDPTAAHSR